MIEKFLVIYGLFGTYLLHSSAFSKFYPLKVQRLACNVRPNLFPSVPKTANPKILAQSLNFNLPDAAYRTHITSTNSPINKLKSVLKFHINNIRKITANITRKLKHVIAAFLLAASFFISTPSTAFAARSNEKGPVIQSKMKVSSTRMKESTSVKSSKQVNAKRDSKSKNKKIIELPVPDPQEEEAERLKQQQSLLSKVGMGITAVVAVTILVAPAGEVPSKKGSRKRRAPQPASLGSIDLSKVLGSNPDEVDPFADEDFELPPPPSPRFDALQKKDGGPKKNLWRQNLEDSKAKPFQLKNDFFDEDDNDNDGGGEVDSIPDTASKKAAASSGTPTPVPPPAPLQQGRGRRSSIRLDNSYLEKQPAVAEEDVDVGESDSSVPPYGFIMPAPDESKLPLPPTAPLTPTPLSTPAAPSNNKKGMGGGILGRLFQKPGSGRPAEIAQALKSKDLETEEYRRVAAACLAGLAPGDSVPELQSFAMRGLPAEEMIQLIKEEITAWDLSEDKAAGAFADVTNAIVVSLVDRAVATLEDKDSAESDAATVAALDDLTDFISAAGNIFVTLHPAAVQNIAPVQYNGKAKRQNLETVYLRYLKAGANLTDVVSAMSGAGAAEGDSPSEKSFGVDRTDRLPKVQFLLNINEGKRASLEQKMFKDMLLGGGLGGLGEALGGGGGGLGGIMDAFNGNKGAPSEKDLEEMFAAAGGPSGFDGNIPGLPEDMKNMKPEEMERVFKETMATLKESVDANAIKKSDVLEFEKITGSDVGQMLKMLDATKGRGLPPEMKDTIELIRKLAEIKKGP